MKIIFFLVCFFISLLQVQAALPGQMNLKHGYQMYTMSVRDAKLWANYDKTFWQDKEIKLSSNEVSKISHLIVIKSVKGVDRAYIANFLQEKIAPKVFKAVKNAKITIENEKVIFSNDMTKGEELDIDLSAKIIEKALNNNIDEIELAVKYIEPQLDIASELKMVGIKEIIALGESDFSGSSENRIHNIKTAIAKFNGTIIKPRQEFSFNAVLGEVDGTTGYKKELVIKGDETPMEWGGGVCQVSSTFYRAIMLAGFPIKERTNHSYSVAYYNPAGSDATVYPGVRDLIFINDTDQAILVYPHIEIENKKLFFTLISSKNSKQVTLFGPYITNNIPAPPTKFLPSKNLLDGEKFLMSNAHNGFISTWYRQVDNVSEKFVSKYQARPKVYKVGGLNEVRIGSL